MELPAKVSKAIVRALSSTSAQQATASSVKSKSAKKRKARKSSSTFAPAAVSRMMSSGNPMIMSTDGNLRIKHREYLGEASAYVSGDIDYVNVAYYEVNPGLRGTFPWFYKMARGFESYTVNNLSVEYVPNCPTSTAGSVIIAPDFDVSDWAPETVAQMQVMVGAVRGPAWMPLRMSPPSTLFKKVVAERMIRSGDIDEVDYKLYDCCCIYVGTTGFAANSRPGSLWMEYDITLRTPSPTVFPDYDNTQVWAPVNGIAKATPFGDGTAEEASYTLDPVLARNSSTGLRFEKPGSYLLEFDVVGTGITNNVPTLSVSDAAAGAFKAVAAIASADGTRGVYETLVNVIRPVVLSFVSAAAWTTVTGMRVKAAPCPYTFPYAY